ncbi:hypothetical protein [Qipengyuania gaetbuli]|uniref:hypothetical protein n=1 Tax=Qipengyuania gaetbuli TaxID=266952 RepID=UPI001CFCC77D|nr:hypothetical protein [Qipengyuania gaetbuli]
MRTLNAHCATAISKTKAAITALDADYAQAPAPFSPRPNASAGELLLAAKDADVDPLAIVNLNRARLKRRLKEARAELVTAKERLADLELAVRCLRTNRKPDGLPPDLAAAVRTVKAASAAGVLNASQVAAQMEGPLKVARKRLDANRLRQRALVATALVAASNQSALYLGRWPTFKGLASKKAEQTETLKRARNKLNAAAKAALRNVEA